MKAVDASCTHKPAPAIAISTRLGDDRARNYRLRCSEAPAFLGHLKLVRRRTCSFDKTVKLRKFGRQIWAGGYVSDDFKGALLQRTKKHKNGRAYFSCDGMASQLQRVVKREAAACCD